MHYPHEHAYALEDLEPRLLMSGAMIITSEALAGAFEQVSGWYTQKGHPAEIVTIETIYANYDGVDSAEKIRNCIRDYHANRDVLYVLLGGDDSIVPNRQVAAARGKDISTDLYYSSLTGQWDADGDGVFGEVDDDVVNFDIDTIVARYPVQTAGEVAVLFAKVVAYETAPPEADWADNGLLIGKGGKKSDLRGGQTSWDRYAPGDFASKKKKENKKKKDKKDKKKNKLDLWSLMGDGYQFMHYGTQAKKPAQSLQAGLFDSSGDLVNVAIVSATALHGRVFGEVSLGESLLLSNRTGTVVYLGSGREGVKGGSWTRTALKYSQAFYTEFSSGASTVAGDVYAEMKSSFADRCADEGPARWLQFSMNFLGDPLVQMYRDDPLVLAPTYEGEITEGEQVFTVSGLSAGAKVVLSQGEDVYVVGTADADGLFGATIAPDEGSLKVTVVASGAAVYTGDVTVLEAEQALPFVVDGNTVTFTGTGGDDVFAFLAGSAEHSVTLNGQTWTFDAASITRIELEGNGGSDAATLTAASGDHAVLNKGQATLTGTNYLAMVTHVAAVTVEGRGTGTAVFNDSQGDDYFVGSPTESSMSGEGFLNTVKGFDSVTAVATAGGTDEARLSDSAGDDRFVGAESYSYLSGEGFTIRVEGFDAIYATASTGYDGASLYDSRGDDAFVGTGAFAYMDGAAVLNYTEGFDAVLALANGGGYDQADLTAADAADKVTHGLNYAYIQGADYLVFAGGGFEEIHTSVAS